MTRLLLALLAALALETACTTAHHAAEDATDTGAQAVHKTGHVLKHGARKVENNL